MKLSLAAEAEQELVEGALFYAREANAELGHAFISEFERSAALLLEILASVPVGAAAFGGSRYAGSRTASSTTSPSPKSASLQLPIRVASPVSGMGDRRADARLHEAQPRPNPLHRADMLSRQARSCRSAQTLIWLLPVNRAHPILCGCSTCATAVAGRGTRREPMVAHP